MITVSGKTFDHRYRLHDLNGLFDRNTKTWELLDTPEVKAWRATNPVGLVFTEQRDPEPAPVKPALEPSRIGKSILLGSSSEYLTYFSGPAPHVFAGFDSLDELISAIEATPADIVSDKLDRRNYAWRTDRSEWFATKNMTDAIKLARNGWSDGIELAERAMTVLEADNATRRRHVNALVGGTVNVGRMLSGEPVHMRTRAKHPGRKVITLFVEVFTSVTVTADTGIIRAACIAAIVDLLEAADYSCEIVSIWTSRDDYKRNAFTLATKIKQAGEALNLENIIFALGHPSMMRRFGLAMAAQREEIRYFWKSSFGLPSMAFDTGHPTGSNEFYFSYLNTEKQNAMDRTRGGFDAEVRKMFDLIVPPELPVKIAADR